MGQQEIIDLLKKENDFLSRSQIAEKLNTKGNHISTLLNKLLDQGEIIFKEIDRLQAQQFSKTIKRRMRLYKLKS